MVERAGRMIGMAALAVALAVSAGPVRAEKQVVTKSVFSQRIGFMLPDGFVPAFENERGDNFIHESIPDGETLDDWSEMITLTVGKGLGSRPDTNLIGYANAFGDGFARNCPDTFSAAEVQKTRVEAREAFVAYFACGTVSSAPTPRSEAVTVIFIKGTDDLITLQYAERGEAEETRPAFDAETWKARMASLFPVSICGLPPDAADEERGCEAE